LLLRIACKKTALWYMVERDSQQQRKQKDEREIYP